MNDAIINKLRTILFEELDLHLTPHQMDETYPLFEDGSGLDSVIIVEFIALIEKRFNIEFTDDELSSYQLNSLGSIAECIAGKR